MKKSILLTAFFESIEKDRRLGISHIGLYMTLFYLWEKQGFHGPVIAFGKEVMQLSRIGSTATYQKLIRQLGQYGYICYMPSLYKGRGSRIFMSPESQTGKGTEELT
jgi:hypothetical protein